MEQKFYVCEHCGKIAAIVKESGVPLMCCGEKMKELIIQIRQETDNLNVSDEKIAEKLKKGAAARAKKKGKKIDDNLSLYEYYISILAVGENKDWNQLLEYTVPQLTDEFKRFQRKNEFDAYRQAIMAGAQNLEEVHHWMVDNDKIS